MWFPLVIDKVASRIWMEKKVLNIGEDYFVCAFTIVTH